MLGAFLVCLAFACGLSCNARKASSSTSFCGCPPDAPRKPTRRPRGLQGPLLPLQDVPRRPKDAPKPLPRRPKSSEDLEGDFDRNGRPDPLQTPILDRFGMDFGLFQVEFWNVPRCLLGPHPYFELDTCLAFAPIGNITRFPFPCLVKQYLFDACSTVNLEDTVEDAPGQGTLAILAFAHCSANMPT